MVDMKMYNMPVISDILMREKKISFARDIYLTTTRVYFKNIFMYPEHFFGHNKSLLDCPQRL